jgi:hypothetical protein
MTYTQSFFLALRLSSYIELDVFMPDFNYFYATIDRVKGHLYCLVKALYNSQYCVNIFSIESLVFLVLLSP